jgi:type II secretory pathway pseudopilin PulG
VAVLIGILTAIALGFHGAARDRASDATAKSNIRVAIPAIEAYQGDNGSYTGVTLDDLQTSYSPGVQGIVILAADSSGYCVSSTVSGRSWYLHGPDGEITPTSCA